MSKAFTYFKNKSHQLVSMLTAYNRKNTTKKGPDVYYFQFSTKWKQTPPGSMEYAQPRLERLRLLYTIAIATSSPHYPPHECLRVDSGDLNLWFVQRFIIIVYLTLLQVEDLVHKSPPKQETLMPKSKREKEYRAKELSTIHSSYSHQMCQTCMLAFTTEVWNGYDCMYLYAIDFECGIWGNSYCLWMTTPQQAIYKSCIIYRFGKVGISYLQIVNFNQERNSNSS